MVSDPPAEGLQRPAYRPAARLRRGAGSLAALLLFARGARGAHAKPRPPLAGCLLVLSGMGSRVVRALAMGAAAALAALLLVFALDVAARSLEPYVDSPRTFFAALASLAALTAAGLLAVVMRVLGEATSWEPLTLVRRVAVYATAAVLVAVPLVRSATNDAYESSIGRGGPPLALLLVAAFAASVALATVMARHVLRGFATVGAAWSRARCAAWPATTGLLDPAGALSVAGARPPQ